MIGMAKGFVITVNKMLYRSLTVQYPLVKVEIPARSRSFMRLTVDPETGDLKCKCCELCAKSCPEDAIHYEAEAGEDKKRWLTRFEVDLGRCMFCGLCVEQCPSDALENAVDYEFATTDKTELTKDLLGAARSHRAADTGEEVAD